MENGTEVTLELIRRLTINDVRILSDLKLIAEKAAKAEQMIRKIYTFMIGQEELDVYEESETLSKDGTWTAQYNYEKYTVVCSEDQIFKLFKAEYLMEHGMKNLAIKEIGLEEKPLKNTCKFFNSFIDRTEKMYTEKLI